jgi:aquaporin Z
VIPARCPSDVATPDRSGAVAGRLRGAAGALRASWREGLMEAALLGAFMVAASLGAALLEHAGSPVHAWLSQAPVTRRVLMGLAMGLTAVGLIRSPWGRRSGAHFNPAVTLVAWRLGRMDGARAALYVACQHAGAVAGMALAALVLGGALDAPGVRHVLTQPGDAGVAGAFGGEVAISFVLMGGVLLLSARPALERHAPLLAGGLLAAFIAFESPFSGTSLNPARSLGSAWSAGDYRWLWLYYAAPVLGMQLAAGTFLLLRRRGALAALEASSPWTCKSTTTS